LLVPCGYGAELKAAGPLGTRPDVKFVSDWDWFARSHLPRSLGRMTFTFRRMPHVFPGLDNREIVQNFYHHGDYFIVTEPLVEFLRKAIPGGVETVAIDVRHDDDRAAGEPYFAAKIVRTVDCIDPSASMASFTWPEKKTMTFKQGMVAFDLGEEAAREFANVDGSRYVSFPNWHNATTVRLVEGRAPVDAVAFQPALWPGHLLVTQQFAEELQDCCRGGTPGYYFWTLDLAKPSADYSDLLRSLR
jgi:hypothetical protein